MSNERTVRVSGPSSLAELAERVREILDLPEGEFGATMWHTLAVYVRKTAIGGYDYMVTVYTGHLADGQARQVYDGIVAATDWAVCLLDETAEPIAERPAVSRAS